MSARSVVAFTVLSFWASSASLLASETKGISQARQLSSCVRAEAIRLDDQLSDVRSVAEAALLSCDELRKALKEVHVEALDEIYGSSRSQSDKNNLAKENMKDFEQAAVSVGMLGVLEARKSNAPNR